MAGYLVKKHLWKTKDGKIVRDGDPRSAFLFAVPGMVLAAEPHIEAMPGEKLVNPKDKKAITPKEDKALKPEENKALEPEENKGGDEE